MAKDMAVCKCLSMMVGLFPSSDENMSWTDVTVINVYKAAPNLSSGGHLTTQDRVSFSQPRPGKHGSLAKSIYTKAEFIQSKI